ncbi:hypothetical protein AAES_07817 [Amazona aestiva]|uniref:Uncharacterized protein n=1 Tax=Amazona aestiva TaxID=12930 RepID=A0A0Q3X9N1_AMAAE|nr:hypothetical protein AAES_07817 [Amazona aestiva]
MKVCKKLRKKAEAKKLKDCFSPNQGLVQALDEPSEEPSIQDHEELPMMSKDTPGTFYDIAQEIMLNLA